MFIIQNYIANEKSSIIRTPKDLRARSHINVSLKYRMAGTRLSVMVKKNFELVKGPWAVDLVRPRVD